MDAEHHEVIVIGAGIFGIAASRNYLKVQPDVDLKILESQSSVGGVWAQERLYPNLRTNNNCPDFEFPDISMQDHGAKLHEPVDGEVVCRYLEYISDTTGCTQRIAFHVEVTEAFETERGWTLLATRWITSSGHSIGEGVEYTCDKLIVACGRFGEPAIPIFDGQEEFGKINIPFKSMASGSTRGKVLGPETSSVTVIGAAKAGFDAVWLAADAGKNVDWIIRPDGFGPAWAMTAVQKVGLTVVHKEQASQIRLMSWLQPSLWDEHDRFRGIRRWFQTSSIGLWFVRSYIKLLQNVILVDYDLKNHPERQALVPSISPYWKGGSLAGLNFPGDFWQHIESGRVKIHRRNIESLGPDGRINLVGGDMIKTDALISCIGWRDIKLPIRFPSLPGFPYAEPDKAYEATPDQVAKVDAILYDRYPIFKERPPTPAAPAAIRTNHLYRQNLLGIPYRGMVPTAHVVENKRKVVFMGYVAVASGPSGADFQALWTVAYLTSNESPRGNFVLNPDKKTLEQLNFDALLEARWSFLRTPGSPTNSGLDIVFDRLSYFDLLQRDLGLNPYRKQRGWLGLNWREWLQPYTIQDHKGLLDEWLAAGKRESDVETEDEHQK